MNDELKLKSCPFCGEYPIVDEASRPPIGCDNMDCLVQPHADSVKSWNSRPPVEAQAKGDKRYDGYYQLTTGGKWEIHGAPTPQPTPPAAETREAREAYHLDSTVQRMTDAKCDVWEIVAALSKEKRDFANEVIRLRMSEVLPHPEPQAPRVSMEAMEWLERNFDMRYAANRHAKEILRALSQPAQGECKTGAEEALLEFLMSEYDRDEEGEEALSLDAWFVKMGELQAAVAAERAKGRGEG